MNLCLKHHRALGDTLVLTALIRDLKLTYGDKFSISVDTNCMSLWDNNPYITNNSTNEELTLSYGDNLKKVKIDKKHFLLGFHDDFYLKTKIPVPLLYPWPDYHLSVQERLPLIGGRYWVILTGGKSDFPVKHWVYRRFQQIVNILRGFGLRFVQVGGQGIGPKTGIKHNHPKLENVLCLVGKTTVRDFARIISQADGVICGITAAMHFAAAFHKPCVVIAGGREDWWWFGYIKGSNIFGDAIKEDIRVDHEVLHTISKLDCCQNNGCWKNDFNDGSYQCKKFYDVNGQLTPKCMDLITTNHVIEAVMRYYENKIIPPIKEPREIVFINDVPHFKDEFSTRVLNLSETAKILTFDEPVLLMDTEGIKLIRDKESRNI